MVEASYFETSANEINLTKTNFKKNYCTLLRGKIVSVTQKMLDRNSSPRGLGFV